MNPLDRRSFTTLFCATLLGATLFVHGQGKSHEHDRGHGQDGNRGNDDDRDQGHGHGNGHGDEKHGDRNASYFRTQDYDSLSRYYSGPRDLPPGLRKKYHRTGSLPPGWQKRFQPMPAAALQQLPPIPSNYQRGYLDGYAVVVDPRTRIIVDVVDLLNVATGR